MVGKLPAFQFYTGDWMKDPALSMCSPATRGIWMDLLCAMHENGRSGQLTGTTEQLARLCRCSTADLSSALDDLQVTRAADVTIRNGCVTVMSRRMMREAMERKSSAYRQSRRRSKEKSECHADVTKKSRSPSSSSSSSSDLSSNEERSPPDPPRVGKRSRFVPPSVAEVAAYCRERGSSIDPQVFVSFYESKGWMVGKSPMKDWRQAVVTWERRDSSGVVNGQRRDLFSELRKSAERMTRNGGLLE